MDYTTLKSNNCVNVECCLNINTTIFTLYMIIFGYTLFKQIWSSQQQHIKKINTIITIIVDLTFFLKDCDIWNNFYLNHSKS